MSSIWHSRLSLPMPWSHVEKGKGGGPTGAKSLSQVSLLHPDFAVMFPTFLFQQSKEWEGYPRDSCCFWIANLQECMKHGNSHRVWRGNS